MESSDYLSQVQSLITAFANHGSTTTEDKSALFDFLRATPRRHVGAAYFIDNLQYRLHIAEKCQRWVEENRLPTSILSATTWAILMVVPESYLKNSSDNSIGDFLLKMEALIDSVLVLLKIFLTKPVAESLLVLAQIDPEELVHRQKRSIPEAEKCLQRDSQQCVVTGASYPDACHIFPFSSLQRPTTTGATLSRTLFYIWGAQRRGSLEGLLVGENNIVDTASNMISLDPRIHRLWGKGLIAFEPIAQLENGVRVRFRWMNRAANFRLGDKIPLNTNPLTAMSFPQSEGSLQVRHARTGRPILDGEIIDITSNDPETIPNMEILKLQWDLIRMACLSAAAEASENPLWDPRLDDPMSLIPPRPITSHRPLDDVVPITGHGGVSESEPGSATPESQPERTSHAEQREETSNSPGPDSKLSMR